MQQRKEHGDSLLLVDTSLHHCEPAVGGHELQSGAEPGGDLTAFLKTIGECDGEVSTSPQWRTPQGLQEKHQQHLRPIPPQG